MTKKYFILFSILFYFLERYSLLKLFDQTVMVIPREMHMSVFKIFCSKEASSGENENCILIMVKPISGKKCDVSKKNSRTFYTLLLH